MALINCKKCGKTVSDTVLNCIHCGAPLKEEPNAEQETSKKDVFPLFTDLSDTERTAIENEFLSSDKKSMRYRQRCAEKSKFGTLSLLLFVLGRVLLYAQDYVLNNLFTVYNPEFIDLSEKLLVGIVILWAVTDAIAIYLAIVAKSRVKKQLYKKKLQRWILINKNMDYTPKFLSEKDRLVFNSIDLDTMN